MIRHPAAPPPGDSPEANCDDFERRYAALNLAQLAAMVGAVSDEAKDRFDGALRRILSDFHLFMRNPAAPTRREMRAELAAIESRAPALLAALEALHYETWMEMQVSYEQRITDDFDEDRWGQEGLNFADVEWDVITDAIARLRDVVVETRVNLPPARKGRRTEFGIRNLVATLARIYQAHSGEPAYSKFSYDPESGEASSPFLLFVVAVLSGFAPEFQRSNNSLAEVIRRTVGDRART